MSENSKGKESERPDQHAEELVTWNVHPARHNLPKAILVSLTILLLTYFSSWYAGKPFGVLAFALLSGSLWPFYVPTRYRITSWGVEQIRWPVRQKRPWSHFRRYEVDARGILLSPFISPSRLDSFRGMYLLTYTGSQEIQEVVAAQLGNREE
jgi:hypothetical protein